MADISISLNNIRNTRSLYVEDLGVAFTVRKLGAGEELDLSDKMRRLMAIATELKGLDLTSLDENNPEDAKKLSDNTELIEKYTQEINDIKRFELETYKKCFSDENDGKDVELLINGLSDKERTELFAQIFDKPKIIEKPKE